MQAISRARVKLQACIRSRGFSVTRPESLQTRPTFVNVSADPIAVVFISLTLKALRRQRTEYHTRLCVVSRSDVKAGKMKTCFYLDIPPFEAAHLVAIVMTVNITFRMSNNYS